MNRKLKLNLEDLIVDSFDTTRPSQKQGTVFGEQCTCYTQCTCPGCPTCDATCPNTCVNTCDDASCVEGCGDDDTLYFTCNPMECGPSAAKPWLSCGDIC